MTPEFADPGRIAQAVVAELGISPHEKTLVYLQRTLQTQVDSVTQALDIASHYPLLILATFEEHVLMKLGMINPREADTKVESCIEAGLGPLTKHPLVMQMFGDDLPIEVSLKACVHASV